MWCYIRIWSGRRYQAVTDLVYNTVPTPIRQRNVCKGERVRPREVFGGLRRIGHRRSGDTNSQRTLCQGIIQTLIAQADDRQHLPQDLLQWVSLVVQ
jgi:hypothetical protein